MSPEPASPPRDRALGTFVRRHFEPLVLGVQVLVDVVVVLLACVAAFEIGRRLGGVGANVPWGVYREFWGLTVLVCIAVFHFFGMYSPVKSLLNVEEFKAIAKGTVVAFFVTFTLIVLLRSTKQEPEGPLYGPLVAFHKWIDLQLDPTAFSRLTSLVTFVLILLFTTVSRFFSFKFIQGLHRRGIGNRNALIIGNGPTAQWLVRKLLLVPTLGLRLVGMACVGPDQVGRSYERARVLGTLADLERLVAEYKVHEVFVALPEETEDELMDIIGRLERAGTKYRVVPRFYHLMSQRVKLENLDSIPLISRPDRRLGFFAAAAKRSLDLLLASVALLLTAPVFALAAVLIRRDSPGPIFYRQTRVGKLGRPFRMFKFRTMYLHLSGDAPAPKTHDDPRITPVGRWLRRYSLDELPQFLNVLRGEMSIVGPRPEMPFIVAGYGPLERERLRAKPGITGLWQISYARTQAIHENIDYDIYYVEHRSVLLDLVIIFLTFFAVVKGTGAH
ncbi:MAG TPA: sugar transferase [Planctomycetota bacterium]|nr:sugar transferase [Planctomycetota bacterium]